MAETRHSTQVGAAPNQVVVGGRCLVAIQGRGSATTSLAAGQAPILERRQPVRSVPSLRGPAPLGRDGEMARITAAAKPGTVIHVRGAPGTGKTTLARHLARMLAVEGDEVLFLEAADRDVADLVQDLFEACFDVESFRPDPAELGRLMGDWHGVVVVDDLAATPDGISALAAAASGACLVFTSTEALDGHDAHAIRLEGLSLEAGSSLVERELGRPLEPAERAPVAAIWEAVGGRPRAIVQAVEATCPTGDDHVTPVDPGTLTATLVERLDDAAAQVLALLVALGPVTVGAEVLEAMVGRSPLHDAYRLARCGLVTTSALGYQADEALAASPPDRLLRPPSEITRAATALTAWLTSAAVSPRLVGASASAIVSLVDLATSRGQEQAACALARAAAPAVALSLRWGAWRRILDSGATAARLVGDTQASAYFDHEQRIRSQASDTSFRPAEQAGAGPPGSAGQRSAAASATAPVGPGAGHVLVPPLRLRLVAFLVDLLLVAAIEVVVVWMASEQRTLASLALTFVAYHTTLVWLTGATTGKFMFGLEVRRLGDRPYRRRPGGLAWVLLRTTVGYFVVDLGVVGLLVAVFTPDHRPLHDLVFRSRVAYAPGPATATRGMRRHAERMEHYGTEVETALDELRPDSQALAFGRWLVSAAAALRFLLDRLRAFGDWIARAFQAQPAPAAASPTTTLAVGPTLAVVATSAVVAVAGVSVYGRPPDEDRAARDAYVQALTAGLSEEVFHTISAEDRTCFSEVTVDAVGLDNLGADVTPDEVREQGGNLTIFLRADTERGRLDDASYANAVAGCLDLTTLLTNVFTIGQSTPEMIDCVRPNLTADDTRELFRQYIRAVAEQGVIESDLWLRFGVLVTGCT